MENLRQLLVPEMQDLYSAENQILEALPKMISAVGSDDLREGCASTSSRRTIKSPA